ncbi:substrate-binding domain-containing protein [Pricia sp.]|uniref:substrate-binding domain-containing protein n=1 Tax=Pricia sp. TaxID=2268138 RepID=UPI003593B5AB
MKSKATIKEIAKLANVSIGTVDRVIHKRGDVSKNTTERIQKIMGEIDYEPNTFARNLALNKNFQIAVLLPEHGKEEYWSTPMKGARKAAKDMNSLGLKINYYSYDQYRKESFFSAGRRALKDKNDALVLARVLYEETEIFLKECAKADVPFVLIGTTVDSMNAVSNIGQDSFQSGRLAAELLSFGYTAPSSFLVLNLTKAENPNYNVKHRIEGFHSYFKGREDIAHTIDILTIAQEDKNLLKKIKAELTTSDLNGIFVPNSRSYMLAQALSDKRNIRIVGYDLLDKNKAFMQNGKIDFLINQRSDEQAYQGIECLYRYLVMNQVPPKIISLPLDIVTKEKLMYY